jgi:hypothetical protein
MNFCSATEGAGAGRDRTVQVVPNVAVVQTPSFILPRGAGEDRGEGLKVLNHYKD